MRPPGSRSDVGTRELTTAVIAWETWGPYHHARFAAAQQRLRADGVELIGLQMFDHSKTYRWEPAPLPEGVHSLSLPEGRHRSPLLSLWLRSRPYLSNPRPIACFIPSYTTWSGWLLLICLLRRIPRVMMNETHASTAKQRGRIGLWLKRRVVRRFDAALVGGDIHREYFSSLGLDRRRIALGYDAVDNTYFERHAAETTEADRSRLGLPRSYFLNLGRFVEKKNLGTLIAAYATFVLRCGPGESRALPALVIAGYGPLEADLRRTAAERLGNGDGAGEVVFLGPQDAARVAALLSLATAFVLPSTTEEWGLVVNESMAAGCPVIVSEAAGCAGELIEHGVTGLRFDPSSVEDLAAQLEAMWASDRLRTTLATNARRKVADYGCERFADGVSEALGRASAGRR